MFSKKKGINRFWGNRPFLYYMLSQGISSLGDTFQLIATTALLLDITGSGLSAGFGMLCAPIPSILLSPFAGSLGDRLSEKHMLVILDLLRALVVILFIGTHDVWAIYILLMVLSSLNVLYSPPSRKLIVNILNNDELITGNSLMSGVSGAAYLIGPALAGIFVGLWGVKGAFLINCISFAFSAIMISVIRPNACLHKVHQNKVRSFGNFRNDIKEGIKYFLRVDDIRNLVISCTIISFGVASMNIAFYPFAFDILGVTTKGWGFMLSVFYGTNLAAMFILLKIKAKINKVIMLFIYFMFMIISIVWFSYGITTNLRLVVLLQAVEGVASALCGVLLWSRLLVVSKKSFVGRVTGLNDILNNMGRLLGIGFAYAILYFTSPKFVFMINGVILLTFAILKFPKVLVIGKKRIITLYK